MKILKTYQQFLENKDNSITNPTGIDNLTNIKNLDPFFYKVNQIPEPMADLDPTIADVKVDDENEINYNIDNMTDIVAGISRTIQKFNVNENFDIQKMYMNKSYNDWKNEYEINNNTEKTFIKNVENVFEYLYKLCKGVYYIFNINLNRSEIIDLFDGTYVDGFKHRVVFIFDNDLNFVYDEYFLLKERTNKVVNINRLIFEEHSRENIIHEDSNESLINNVNHNALFIDVFKDKIIKYLEKNKREDLFNHIMNNRDELANYEDYLSKLFLDDILGDDILRKRNTRAEYDYKHVAKPYIKAEKMLNKMRGK